MGGEANQVLWRGVRPVEGIRGVWPARNAERVNESGFLTGTGTSVVYTVPEDKILFVSSLFMTIKNGAQQEVGFHAMVRDDGHAEKYRLMTSYMAEVGQDTASMHYLPALEAEEDWYVYITINVDDVWARLIFSGWLEKA